MGTVTVRKLADDVMRDLRRSAAERGVSMEQEARDRLRQPLRPYHPAASPDSNERRWRLKATMEEIMALSRKPEQPIDHKAESDALYDYLNAK
jgi:plasmid stability protein